MRAASSTTSANFVDVGHWRRLGFALAQDVERDVDDHVLLAAHHAALPELRQDVARIDAVDLGRVLGVAQEARIDAGVAERQALAIDPHRPVLQRPHEVVGDVHQNVQVAAGLDPHAVEHGDQHLDRRVAGARAHAGERGVDAHRAGFDAGDGVGDAQRQIVVGMDADFRLGLQRLRGTP